MKKIKNIAFALIAALTLVSCNDYLNVLPKTEVAENALFMTEKGFQDALTGVYIQMKDDALYGNFMTMGNIEHLVGSWDVQSGSASANLSTFNYSNADLVPVLSKTFASEYTVIANINAILARIDDKKGVFATSAMYEAIKGECLALRAYCHLDLLRLWGPIPSDPEKGNQLAYATRNSTTPNPRISFAAYRNLLLQDLTTAESLLKNVDPITAYTLAELKTTAYKPQDAYWTYRYLRMNYFAVKSLQARAYLWFNDGQKAYECAKTVIDAKNKNGVQTFQLGVLADLTTNKDYNLSCEQIFGLHDFAIPTKYSSTFGSGLFKRGQNDNYIRILLYGNTGTDIREVNQWELLNMPNGITKGYTTKKYRSENNQIAMLRLSEMYLIAIETAPLAEAQNLWSAYRISRRIAVTVLPTDPVAIKNELLKEYRKEFYAEGQSFFAYKRLNADKSQVLPTAPTVPMNYLLPLPPNETLNY